MCLDLRSSDLSTWVLACSRVNHTSALTPYSKQQRARFEGHNFTRARHFALLSSNKVRHTQVSSFTVSKGFCNPCVIHTHTTLARTPVVGENAQAVGAH